MSSPNDAPSLLFRSLLVIATLVVVAVGAKVFSVARRALTTTDPLGVDSVRAPRVAHAAPSIGVADSLYGKSGAVRFRTLTAASALALPGFIKTLGENAIHTPAVHLVTGGLRPPGSRTEGRGPRVEGQGSRVEGRGSARDSSFAYIVMRPFGEKKGEHVGRYRLGRWPAERWMMAKNYFNPDGFVEVTPENQELRLSEHFTLGDFLTHDQRAVWPKYVVLEPKLFDKLELVLQEMASRGVNVSRVVVLSGFRAPYYNDRGLGEGMARGSRHQYGDAADIIIDANGDGRMDDLNGDRRVDFRDTEIILQAIERVERKHPEYAGGLGRYQAMGPSGPFAHIDVRGTSARWEREGKETVGQGTGSR